MENFWDYSTWGFLDLIAVLMLAMLAANMLVRSVKALRASLIPASVLGGMILLVIAAFFKLLTGKVMFNTDFFGGNGSENLEILTYHMLALGFIATTFKSSKGKPTKTRLTEIFNTGVTTVSTYLLQGIFGLAISIAAAALIPGFFSAAGILLPFGYGQGTGQALNYGGIFENDYGFVGGKSFGLTIAALGFLSASIGGVLYLNLLKRQGKIRELRRAEGVLLIEEIQGENEIPMQERIDKITVQIALVVGSYLLAFAIMSGLGKLLPGMRSVIFGFNFLIGVLSATLIKAVMGAMKNMGIIRRDYINNFLMTRISNFFFDVMVVAGIAAIRLQVLRDYLAVILLMGIVGLVITYLYNRFVAGRLFPEYREEQFLMMYGMLTGTASTGTILLRELDPDFRTPASDNMVYQNFPAIVFGFPMMLLATMAPKRPVATLLILIAFFAVMNAILFRSVIFGKKRRQTER